MNNVLVDAIATSQQQSSEREVRFFRLQDPAQLEALTQLITQQPGIRVFDEIQPQLAELIRLQHPAERLSETAIAEKVAAHLGNTPPAAYGVWVYYPWSGRVVHILDEAEFVLLRTSRNQHKITEAERKVLQTKKIGVIGLSVGQSVALALAIERLCGELRIADFDKLDLSNMNRIRTGVHHVGILKTVLVAREIAEIDPFLQVRCYDNGISEDNIDAFLTEGGRLDILVEECDGLDIKVLARQRARAMHIPVVMDTSDRGMVDVERFDLQHDLPILHGRIPEDITAARIRNMQGPERMQLVDRIVNFNAMSTKMQASLAEIGKTITTWPQLASAVMLGGAAIAHVCREVGLNREIASGRYYVDLEQIFNHDK
ncbi:ThiF family adenylyltransferase [Chitinophaga oryzae]|uniref:ThiF family adenylyltransferase n=1 Tax=Chitinophaga oryzae TaxID=2725414 RepID=A0AAE6ZJI8_9BACT|nr:ThiF family adenylyltransferase [Chitinophaga oryzae]QJB33899.1 ThiF family adenylyltransferase [Chitinophaga oryzae]QJB40429.1 ThiF family adenylyltransferase [Chitinophaga oryzae]